MPPLMLMPPKAWYEPPVRVNVVDTGDAADMLNGRKALLAEVIQKLADDPEGAAA